MLYRSNRETLCNYCSELTEFYDDDEPICEECFEERESEQ